MTLLERCRPWLPRAPEGLVFTLGVLLRLRLAESFDPRWSYDVTPHVDYVQYILDHGALPPLSAHRQACNPPLWYGLAAAVMGRGGTMEDVQLISIGAGIATLALIWAGLRRFFPDDRGARLMGLSLAAVLPCTVHIQGMVTNEALLGALSTATLFFVRPAFEATGRRRWLACAALGLTFAAALCTKISPILFAGAFAGGIALDALWKRRTLGIGGALRRQAPLALGVTFALLVGVPILARHYPSTGILFPTGYDSVKVHSVAHIPLWKRRPVSYYVAPCASDIVARPYYPTCSAPEARFWPVLLATTFADYYNFRYAGMPHGAEPELEVNARGLSERALSAMRASLVAGAVIALTTVGGVIAGLVRALRRRDAALAVVLVAFILALAAQLAFSVRWPYDGYGPIKGSYLQFASAPLFAAFGGAFSWLWRRPALRAVAALQVLAVLVVAGYSVLARWHGFYD